jgi:glutamate synthase domain-containing protein 3
MNAPGLSVVCHGPAADGAGAGLVAGRLAILGHAGPAVGYAQRGGAILVTGDAEARAGLNQSGGVLVLFGRAGVLAGERQTGGVLFASPGQTGRHAGRGRCGGRFLALPPAEDDEDAWGRLLAAVAGIEPWLPDEVLGMIHR